MTEEQLQKAKCVALKRDNAKHLLDTWEKIDRFEYNKARVVGEDEYLKTIEIPRGLFKVIQNSILDYYRAQVEYYNQEIRDL